MSITDATTNLSTSWTENSTVAFTGGTLSSVSDCVSEVQSKLRRGTLSTTTRPTLAEVERWLIRAKQELIEVRNYTWSVRFAYATTSSGTYRYGFPPDYNGGEIMLRDTTNNRMIEVWPDYMFDNKYPDPSEETNSEPLIACIKGAELYLVPPPSGSFRLELQYQRSGDDNTATDFSYLPEIERFRCCDKATAEAFLSLHMWDQATLYEQKWVQGIGKAVKADAKRKWKRMNYQCVSILQQSRAYFNQADK